MGGWGEGGRCPKPRCPRRPSPRGLCRVGLGSLGPLLAQAGTCRKLWLQGQVLVGSPSKKKGAVPTEQRLHHRPPPRPLSAASPARQCSRVHNRKPTPPRFQNRIQKKVSASSTSSLSTNQSGKKPVRKTSFHRPVRFCSLFRGRGISKVVMAPQRIHLLLLLLLLTLLGLVLPSFGQDRMYHRFLRQHVDPEGTGGNDAYCNLMMQRRKMTVRQCKHVNTFIHEDIWNIRSICSTTNIQCKNGKMNCHEGVVKVTDCRETGSSRTPNCRYRASASTRRVVIACEGNPEMPVHFDR
uniref:Ribonuclease 4 n=2 Tax=Suricata suricatta TaxID=37032 RepID=A0A673TT42_SURSU